MKRPILLVSLLVLAFSAVQAQSIYVSISGGFSGMNPASGYTFMYQGDRMLWPGRFEEVVGQKSDIGFNITSAIEYRLPIAPISLTAGISYAQFYGKTDYVKACSPPWYGTAYTQGELNTRHNLLTFRTGTKWEINRSRIAPFMSIELLYNLFGDTRLTIHNSYLNTDAVVSDNERVGLSFGGGLRVNILPLIDVSVGANYSLNNLVTPDTNEEQRNMLSIGASLFFKLL